MTSQQAEAPDAGEVRGPVDVAVIVFAQPEPDPDVAPALATLQDSGTVRLLDGAFVAKDDEGRAGFMELADSETGQAYAALCQHRHELLNDTDLADVADSLDAGTSGLVLVVENLWAARFAETVRASAGRLTAFQRIPHDRLEVALAAGDL